MTSENGIAQGFTSYGRPVFEIPGRVLSISIDTEPTVETESTPHNVNDVYTLLGANYQPIAENLKTYAFARSAALRWSRMLGEPVTLYRHDQIDLDDIGECDVLTLKDTVSAHAMSAVEYARESLAAERGRIVNAIDEMRSVEMDARAMHEDARDALNGLDALTAILDAPGMPIVAMARAIAERFETVEWYVLVRRDDDDMIAELAAQ